MIKDEKSAVKKIKSGMSVRNAGAQEVTVLNKVVRKGLKRLNGDF